MQTMPRNTGKGSAPRLRADAGRNHDRIVAAAEDAFIESGADVPLDEIARRAGVGNATLYRHFPDRSALVRGVLLAVSARAARTAEAVLAESPDAFTALSRFVHDSVQWKIGALCPVISRWADPWEPELLGARERMTEAVGEIVRRAQAEGSLRTDVGVDDLLLAVALVVRPLPGASVSMCGPLVPRYLQLLLDGLRTPLPSPLPGDPATLESLRGQCLVHPPEQTPAR